jgi:hypothetical protein
MQNNKKVTMIGFEKSGVTEKNMSIHWSTQNLSPHVGNLELENFIPSRITIRGLKVQGFT